MIKRKIILLFISSREAKNCIFHSWFRMTSRAILYDVIVQNNLPCFKIVYSKEGIQIFRMNMRVISSHDSPLMNYRFFASLCEEMPNSFQKFGYPLCIWGLFWLLFDCDNFLILSTAWTMGVIVFWS